MPARTDFFEIQVVLQHTEYRIVDRARVIEAQNLGSARCNRRQHDRKVLALLLDQAPGGLVETGRRPRPIALLLDEARMALRLVFAP